MVENVRKCLRCGEVMIGATPSRLRCTPCARAEKLDRRRKLKGHRSNRLCVVCRIALGHTDRRFRYCATCRQTRPEIHADMTEGRCHLCSEIFMTRDATRRRFCDDCRKSRKNEARRLKHQRLSGPAIQGSKKERKLRDVAAEAVKQMEIPPLPPCRGTKPHHWILGETRAMLTPGRCKRCRRRYTFISPSPSFGPIESALFKGARNSK